MRVQLLFFGILKDEIEASPVEMPEGSTVGNLLALVRERFTGRPALVELISRVAISVNAEYATSRRTLVEGDVVGFLPPVSGGTIDCVTYLTRDAIAAGVLVANAKQGSDGALVVFDGIVRDNTRGRKTVYLDYEAYEEMASRQIVELASQAIARFGIRHVTLVHRLGSLGVGDTSVLIVVASAHRAAAFEACHWLIDTLKKTVPIWKKEMFEDGAVWADGEPFPPELIAMPVQERRS